MIETIDLENNHTLLTRDERENVLEITDALDQTTLFSYDLLDRVTEISRGNREIHYTYKPNSSDFGGFGSLCQVTDAMGRHIRIIMIWMTR